MTDDDASALIDRMRSLRTSAAMRNLSVPALAAAIDYGVGLFGRLLEAPGIADEAGAEDRFAVVFPYLHLIEMIDGTAALLSEAAPIPARLPVRSAFEAMLTIEYVLASNRIRRARAWIVCDVHRRIYLYEMHDPTTEAGKSYAQARTDDMLIGSHPLLTLDSRPRTAPLRAMLAKPEYAEVEAEFHKLSKPRRPPPPWYSFFGGPTTLKKLADHLRFGGYFGILYRVWSGTAHAQDLYRQLIPSSTGHVTVRCLRENAEHAFIATNALGFFMHATLTALKTYLPDEVEPWQEWYVRSLQTPFMSLSRGGLTS